MAATAEQPAAPPEETLAWEARNRARAGWLAVAAGVITILGAVVSGAAQSGVPRAQDRIVTALEALGRAAAGRPQPSGRLAAIAQYLGEHPAPFIAGGVLLGIGGLLSFAPLAYLYRSSRARRARIPQLALVAAAIGAVGFGLGQAVTRTAYYLGAVDFTNSSDRSNSAAADALNNSAVLTGGLVGQIGQLALALALVLISLNAMRAGLLTRFTGFLGVIVGITLILPLDQFGIIRSFWLGAVGMVILGRWPGGTPRAWATGRAEPWPSRQQQMEARQAGGGGRGRGGGPAPRRRGARPPERDVAPEPQRPEPAATGAARKRKRRKR